MPTKRVADPTKASPRDGSSLVASISRRKGVARMLVEREEGGAIVLTLGPGFAASWGEIGPAGKVREVAVSRARGAFAVVTTDLKVSGDRIRRGLLTEYARGIVRRDTIVVDGHTIDRTVHWDLPGKRSAVATYKEWERALRLLKNGKEVGHVVTTGGPTPTGWQSTSGSLYTPLNFQGDELGDFSKLTRPGSLKATIQDPGDGGTKTIRVSGTSADGELDFLFVHGPNGASQLGQGLPSHLDAPLRGVTDRIELVWKQGYYVGARETYEHPNGQVDVLFHWNGGRNEGPGSDASYSSGSIKVTWHPDTGGYTADGKWQDAKGSGSWHSDTDRNGNAHGTYNSTNKDGSTATGNWDRTNNGDGSFSDRSYSEGKRADGTTTERSASASDGKGNSSTSTITTDSKGNPVLTTVSKGADGSRTEKKYDKDGKEIESKPEPKPAPSGSGGGDQGDDDKGDHDHGGTDLPVDDGSGSHPSPNTINAMEGYTEMPVGDGSDPEPRPDVAGSGEAVFEEWLAHGSPFLGGASSSGSRFRGNPVNRILAAMGDEGDGDGTGQGNDEDPGFGIDLRAILIEERDPEHNPRILFETLALFTGVGPSSGSLQAADKVVKTIRD